MNSLASVFAVLELQRQDLPLVERRRELEPWERPWDVIPLTQCRDVA